MIGGFVGFANLPNQVHRKSVKKGFEFTMMAVGERQSSKSSRSGKKTVKDFLKIFQKNVFLLIGISIDAVFYIVAYNF